VISTSFLAWVSALASARTNRALRPGRRRPSAMPQGKESR
jgi:hypothetical protein